MNKIDRDILYRLFETLDKEMAVEQTLCVIGAAAILGAGHTARQTQDIDVWRPASTINDRDLAEASRAAGMGYNPRDLTVDGIYLQVVMPGVVQLPDFNEGKWATGVGSETLWQGTKLKVVAPPPAIVIAAKLVRGEDRDIDDCAFLIEAKRVPLADIKKAISKITDRRARETARENLVLIEIMDDDPNGRPGPERGKRGQGR